MKWIALLLLVINGLLIWLPNLAPAPRSASENGHRLPRAESLVLVSEMRQAGGNGAVTEAPVAAPPASKAPSAAAETPAQPPSHDTPPPAPDTQCVLLGPFEEPDAAENWDLPLEANQVVGRELRKIEVPMTPLHWVIIPGQADSRQALETLKDLQRRGVDSYLVTTPPHENAISLGLFESLESARRVLARRRAEGLEPILTQMERSRAEWWLKLELATPPALETLEGALETRPCTGVALGSKSP